jgi:hypothetical protein
VAFFIHGKKILPLRRTRCSSLRFAQQSPSNV